MGRQERIKTMFVTSNLCQVGQYLGCELPFHHFENADFAVP